MSLVRATVATFGSSLRRAALMVVLLAALVVSTPGLSEAAEHLPAASTAVVVSQPVSGEDACRSHGGCLEHEARATGTVLPGTQTPESTALPLVAHTRRVPPALPPIGERPFSREHRTGPADLCVWRT